MFFQLVYFKEIKQCRAMVIILSAIVSILLVVSAITGLSELKIKRNYSPVTSTVSDNFHNDGSTWTEFEFIVDQSTYHVKETSTYHYEGQVVELLYNPSNPNEIVTAISLGIYPKIYLYIAGFFAIFDIFYIINFALVKRLQKKKAVSVPD
ncbi:MAG: hypothetical protein AB1Z19_04720 [Eubacteriales bacterium]